jgi:hypothetical protein
MDNTGEDTIDRLIAERDAALVEAADLRRQLAEAQAEWRIMSGALDIVIAERTALCAESPDRGAGALCFPTDPS